MEEIKTVTLRIDLTWRADLHDIIEASLGRLLPAVEQAATRALTQGIRCTAQIDIIEDAPTAQDDEDEA